ncbi:hypothetical protein VK792_02110 [Mesobacterium sp. TK19101]|uniref:Uncharacterized protein n=1 Tax=Mesobacterium hydrothermale TaxID=3111907 RepID=A0ABU6HC70_9RHOB|nr:hypothetical protein [Mesobacterium sp. TK19101]MEC3860068.1 hypothetical protein [Mesobacterium sp. TK19101]
MVNKVALAEMGPLGKSAYRPRERSSKQTDHVTDHLVAMFRANVILQVGAPACIAVFCAFSLVEDLKDTANAAFTSNTKSLMAQLESHGAPRGAYSH